MDVGKEHNQQERSSNNIIFDTLSGDGYIYIAIELRKTL